MSISRVDVGTPPRDFKGWVAANVCFHGFADLPTMRDDDTVISPQFSFLGHKWRLWIYPGGTNDSVEGYTAIYLYNCSDTSIKISYGFSVRDANGIEVVHHEPQTDEFGALSSTPGSGNNAFGYTNFEKRSTLMDLLVQGSLVIEVRMKLPSTNKRVTQFIPTNPINKNVLELFMDEESADLLFEVGELQAKGKRKRAKTSTANYHAHRLIVKNNTSTLYEMCGKSDEGRMTTVSITDVTPEIFGHMIYYTYGGKLSKEDLKSNAKDIINACDKYGLVHLKLEAEACYVESNEIKMENIMDNLLYADSKNLALLKEAVMDYIVANKHDIIGKVSFDNFPSHLVTDLLTAMARGEEAGDEEEEDKVKYNKMRVGTLRKMLDEKGLDVDGSRETMIALLKENNNDSDDD